MTFTESSIKNYILNAFNIHSNEVTDLEIIPDEFTDPYTYQSTFYPLLLHETIKQLKNSYKLLVINIDLHLHSHYFQFDSNSDFEFKANDVFYVVFDPSSSIRIPRNAGYFVFVVENVDDDSCLCHVSYSDMVNDIPSVQSNEVSFYYLGNIGKTLNIENAINNSGNDSPIVNAVLRADYTGISNAYLPTDTKLIHLFHKLNKKQLAFVCTALTQSNPVCVLSGPPASGKSFTLTVLTVALLESDSNVVFLNPSMELLLKSVEKLLKCINENDCVDFLQLNNLLIYDDQTDCTNLNSDSLMHSLLLSTRITNICTICSDWLSAYRELINLIHFQWTDSQVQSIEESECIWQDFTIRFNTSYETYQQSSSALMNLWETSPDALLCDEFGNQIKLTNFTKLSNTVDSFVDLFDTLKPFYTRLNDHFIDILLNRSNTTTMSRFFDELFQSGIVKIKTLLSSFDDIEQKCISLSSNQSRKLIRHCLLTETKCIFSTITSTPNLSSVFENHPVVILDQAVQVTEIETLQLLQFESIGHLVMAGDIHQLHARGVSETGRQYKYDRSLFERLMIIPYPRTTLNIQYQIHPDIMIWSNQYFYDSQIITHSSVKKTSKWYENSIFGPIKIFELPGNEQVAGHTSSLSNLLEAKLVVLMLTRFVKLYPDLRLTVGIITLYTAQKRLIESLVVKAGKIKNDTLCIGGLRIDINHPMALQGCSRDIIILSTVRSNSRGDIGSYGIAHLLNFIITRACRSLWIIADFRTFQKNVVWKSLIDCLTKAGCHQVCSADKGFKTTIRHEGVLMAIKDKNMTELEILGAVWTMIFTKKSKTSISKLPKELLPPLISKLIALSSGTLKFRYSSDEFQVFQITVKTYTIICTVALESALEYYHQVIQLWDIVPNNLASKSLDDIRKVLLSRTSEYLEKCRESKTDQIENHVVRTPITFMKSNHPIQFYKNTKSTDFSEVQSQEISEDVTDMVKVYQMNQTVLDCIRDQKLSTMEFPFVLGVQEISLVEYGESAFILGRSGTGKTTVMLSKMMVQEGLYLDMVDYKDLSPPTQWMITCNNRLKDTSEKYYKKLRLSKKELNDTTQPSFWSFFEFLVMLDEKLPNAFFIKVQNADDQLEFRDAMIDEHNQTAEYLTGFYQLKSIVTFEKFITQYFPRISDALTSKYSASIVWTEIQSYIKGSISIVKNSDLSRQYLPLEEYITLSQCRVSVLNDSDRKNIYQIWQAYERLKRLNHQYDIADLTINVYHRVSSQPYKTTVDYLYLDEVQDMTQIQIGLFKYVCFNKNGFVFAGDTAQTISSGVGFRFEDVRKLFYEHFLDSTVVNLPQIWYLTQNYRTHSGILKLSSTLVDLMVHFFPNAVDKVEAENGALIEGNLPSFLVGSSREDLFVQLFGAENSRKESVHREMGAEQVIIVRTEEAKLELSKLIGSALILTVYESKGLEFDDVLIYNFFADSTFKRWRNVLSQIDIDDYDSKIDNRLHRFDEKQDHQLCHELKALYVATTRAKCRLWFFDESDPQNAMVEYWSQKECLLLITPTTSHLHFATTSSKESWQQRGDEFFERLQYEQAIVCFDRAGDVKQSSRAKALILIRQAEIFHSQGKKRIVNEMFLKAALIFQSINDLSMAANCYVKVNDFENAALLFWECGDFSKSLASCLHAKLSHLALDLLKKDKSKLNSSNLEKYSRFFAVQCQTNHTMMLEFLSFVSNAAARSFLSRYKYYTLLYNFDKKHNNCLNLAESALNLGYYDECFSNYIQGNQPSKAMDIALRYFLRPKVLLILKGCRKFKNHSFECKYQVVLTKIREFFEKNSFLDYSFGIEVKFILIIIEMESCATLEAFVKKHTLMPHLNLISDMILFNQLNQENNDDRLPDSKEFAVRILQRISSTVAYLNSSRQNQEPLTGFATYYPLDMSYSFADTYKQIFSEYTTLNRISFINFVTLQLTYMKKKLVNQIIGRLEKCTNSLTLCSTVRSKQDCRNPICSFEHNQQIFKSKFPIFLQRKLDIVDIFQIVGHDKTVYNFDRIVQSIIQLMFPNNNVDNDAKPLLLFIVNPKIQFLCECYVRSHLTTHELKTDVQSVMLSFFSRSRAPIDSKTGDLVHELQNAFHWSMEKGNTISVVFYTKYLSSFLTILLKQNVPDLSPHFFLDLMEQYLSSFIALSTSFGLKHKPIGTYLSSIYAYHLHHFQSFNLENFNRKFNDADLVITRLIDYLRDDGEYFRVWFTKYSKENWGTKILMYQRLIRAILLVFLNMPHFHSQLIDLFTNPGFLKFLTKEYQFLGINPIVSLLQEKINSQSPEKEDKTWNSKFYIAIVEYFKFHSDNIYFFSWKKRLGIKYARPLFITEDRVKLSLKHFINCDENRVMNFTEDDDEEEDSSITKVDDDYNQMGGEESNSSMEKIATLSPWILTRLRNIKNRNEF
ncbi:hypothetical protein BC833DRAFT_311271 [Globomyces pollinis-pini]|nr:hypothetical protein BC833DRAFT_311271 [Globomyces pollinis-pini]